MFWNYKNKLDCSLLKNMTIISSCVSIEQKIKRQFVCSALDRNARTMKDEGVVLLLSCSMHGRNNG